MVTQGNPLPEAAYEIQGDLVGCTGGPAARRAVGPTKAPLLGGWSVYLAGALRARQEIMQLVKATGATLLTRAPVGGDHSRRVVVLYDAHAGRGDVLLSTTQQVPEDVPLVSSKWLMDSISSYTVLDVDGYVGV